MAKKKGKEKKPTVQTFDRKATRLAEELKAVRQKISQNEDALQKKISEKARLENQLSGFLRSSFSREKAALSRLKSGSAKRQASLKQRISSLERINNVFDEKKARIVATKKKYNALKRRLASIERKAGALS